MVERQTENLCVNGSIPFVGTKDMINTLSTGDRIMLTKITRIEWATPEDQFGNGQETFNDERTSKIQEMHGAAKTDGHPIALSDVITDRYWLDGASAQEYIDFIMLKTAQYNLNLVSTQIIDA